MEASHKTHRPHIKVGKDEEEEDVRHTWCLLSNLIIYVVDRKRVGKVCHSCFIIFCTENEVYAEKRIRDTYAHILINVNITIGKSNIYIRYSMFVDKRSSHKKCINIQHI